MADHVLDLESKVGSDVCRADAPACPLVVARGPVDPGFEWGGGPVEAVRGGVHPSAKPVPPGRLVGPLPYPVHVVSVACHSTDCRILVRHALSSPGSGIVLGDGRVRGRPLYSTACDCAVESSAWEDCGTKGRVWWAKFFTVRIFRTDQLVSEERPFGRQRSPDAARLSLSRRQSATTQGAPTDQARVCLAAPPPASATLSWCRPEQPRTAYR